MDPSQLHQKSKQRWKHSSKINKRIEHLGVTKTTRKNMCQKIGQAYREAKDNQNCKKGVEQILKGNSKPLCQPETSHMKASIQLWAAIVAFYIVKTNNCAKKI